MFYHYPERHISVRYGEVLDFTETRNWKNHGIYLVETKTLKSNFGALPSYYTYTKDSKHIDQLLVPSKIVEPNRILISYPLSHSIQVYKVDASNRHHSYACGINKPLIIQIENGKIVDHIYLEEGKFEKAKRFFL